jgi:beta-1,4-mannosyltransferase
VEGQLRGLGQSAGDLTLEAVAALRALDAAGHEPLLLAYHPVARMNPYQAMLYQRVWETGIAALPIVREPQIDELTDLARSGWPTVLHLHWLNQVLAHAGSIADARSMQKAFLKRLDRYLAAGGQLVWTVHNIVPHGAQFEAEESALSAAIVERSSVVHIMAAGTRDLVADWFAIPPDKILSVPHPSYAGAYEDVITREQARHELGLWPDEIVHVVVGAIKPYKGLNELFDAWDDVATDGKPRRLVVAGAPSDEPGIAEVIERAAIHPSVLIHPRKIAPADMQIFLRAADVAVMPYVRSLNSGALMLALTFGLPVVAPARGGLAELLDDRMGRVFDPNVAGGLAAALRASDELVSIDARSAAADVAAARAPGPLSEQFASELRSIVERVSRDGRGSDRR